MVGGGLCESTAGALEGVRIRDSSPGDRGSGGCEGIAAGPGVEFWTWSELKLAAGTGGDWRGRELLDERG